MVIRQKDGAIVFSGSVAKEPEIKTFTKTKADGTEYTSKIIKVGVVVDKIREDSGEVKNIWVNAYAFGSILECVAKGDYVFMTGKVENDTYTGQDGAEHTTEKIKVDFVSVMPKVVKPVYSMQSLEQVDNGDLPF